MNLTVEWVETGFLLDNNSKLRYAGVRQRGMIPVIRVATLMRWIEAQERYDIGLDYLHKQLRELLAQLPEEGV